MPRRGNKRGIIIWQGLQWRLRELQNARQDGLEVSEIGYGAWGIAGDAWLGAKDEESLKALEQGRRPRAQFHRHGPGLRRGTQRAAGRG